MSEQSERAAKPVLRADARRNVERIRAAAVEVFRERGLNAPLEEIARRAGVSPGTVYHRFGGRQALIDDVVPDLVAVHFDRVIEAALACEDPWEGFTRYLTGICELEADDPAFRDVVSRRYAETEHLFRVCEGMMAREQQVIDRAVRDGSLRPDFTVEDLAFIYWSTATLVKATEQVAPGAWRRNLALIVDGLRAEAAHPLPVAPLTPDQTLHIMLRLGAGG